MHQAVKDPTRTSAVTAAADRLRTAYGGTPCAPVRDILPKGDLAAAYAVQEHNVHAWQAEGRRIVGYKIGLTSHAVQTQLGVSEPDYGALFADMALLDGEAMAVDRVMQPRAEAEIAFVLGRDLPHHDATPADVLAAVDHAVPAIEIVGSRIAKWDITIVDTIADNGSTGAFVLGTTPRRVSDFDLRLCGMSLWRRGEAVSVGAGAACLGNPINALVWLARTMARLGRPLGAGHVVMSGALGPMIALEPGDTIRAEISGLGSVRTALSRHDEASA